ncbi:Transcription factor [Aspergillus sclerotialis]|uniref:Transcription factor n=1 Tax=Aspergillus sclerotialis TaxID=2070753 RepID=A0A3A2ZJQ5_9EURO|nr:Transcription factor [Aspergillus sclerotialis]
MAPPSAEQTSQPPSGRKRKRLNYARAARACTFCRRRKVRCSGTLPCEYCIKEEVPQSCEYGPGVPPPNLSETQPQNVPQESTNATGCSIAEPAGSSPTERVVRPRGPREQQHDEMPGNSRRNSIEPPQMFAEDQHIGPTAGISFLYHPWNKGEERSSRVLHELHSTAGASSLVPLDSYGDFPQSVLQQPESPYPTHLSPDQISVTLERYFRFATPTYRYMHRPTLEKWATRYVNDDPRLGNAQRACVLLALAQSLLYTVRSDCYVTEDNENIRQSRLCYQKAKDLLDRETGPPSLASVQSRLAMCLYMLSTFRMTACRFCFSVTITILTSLGLHRVHSTKSERVIVDNVESELRRRAFWCAYVLDGYLSVMLGRPRILRDEDVDQPYPRNVDDSDLMSTEPIDDLPQHGNLEAFLAHASLARLMARSSDTLYPLQPLTEEQVLQRSNELLDVLETWKQSLPNFLKPGNKTLTGERMFERQNTVLKLAHATCVFSSQEDACF